MCGIAGFFRKRAGTLPPEFADGLQHRGPDQRGWAILRPEGLESGADLPPSDARGIGLLVHHRLSILDLSQDGRQPMTTEDGRHVIVFNGEIYNYLELRDELVRQGHSFRTGTDTEVLLRAWQAWGRAVLPRLEGMFAFAVVDRREGSVTLVRDFFGIKPLYYTLPHGPNEGFAFASEIGALLELDGVPTAANPETLFHFLRFGLTDHTDETLFAGVHQLPAGSLLVLDVANPTRVRVERYWSLRSSPIDCSFEEACEHTRTLFLQNVERHLRSDVPVGVALSGGIDSSAIVCATRYLRPTADLRAFSFVSSDPRTSEKRWIDIAARAARARLELVHPTGDEFRADAEAYISTYDEPIGTTAAYAQWRVFRRVRDQGVKVMLDGQGADELLGGYDFFYGARLASLLAQGHLAEAAFFVRSASRTPGRRGVWLQAGPYLLPTLVQEWLRRATGRASSPAWLDDTWFDRAGVELRAVERPRGRRAFERELVHAVDAWLPKLLRYTDHNSMTHSVESRVPFLTRELAEWVVSLPPAFLLSRRGVTKHVFREAMRDIVPDAILDRQDKIGFATPTRDWLPAVDTWAREAFESTRAPFVGPELARQWADVRRRGGAMPPHFWRCIAASRWARRHGIEW